MTTPNLSSAAKLGSALDALVSSASAAGLDPALARAEGEALAAAVSEPASGSFGPWASETGRVPDARAFFEAASRGRRWRVSPTPLLTQLVGASPVSAADYAAALASVCTAATMLGEPNAQALEAASKAMAVQLGAVTSGADLVVSSRTPSGSSSLPGAEADLMARLQASRDQLRAMDEFTKAGPGVLGDVLNQLQVNAERIKALREGSLIDLPPGRVGGVPGLSLPGDPGAGTPAAPTPSGVRGSGTPAPVQLAAGAPAVEEPEKPKEPEKSLDELLDELDGLVGLASVKAEIHRQTAILRVDALRQKAGLKTPTITRHLVFVGNPGTGKTTVARLVSSIYKALSLLSKGQLVEADRSELVAGYLGQTALKTADLCKSAVGGVLFIDEAYGLAGDQYGEEAINTLVKEMEDNRKDLVVIVAGYPLPMATFISENPGLASRFRTTIIFDDYTDEELIGIFTGMVTGADYSLGEGAMDAFKTLLGRQTRDETFGNGRFARNVFEAAIGHQAWRLRDSKAPSVDELRTLSPEDLMGDNKVEIVDWGAEDKAIESAAEADKAAAMQAPPASPRGTGGGRSA